MIRITDEACVKVREALAQREIPQDRFLRIGIAGGGCSGLQYALAFDDAYDPAWDTRFTVSDFPIVTKKKFAEFLDGTVIDFKEGPFGSGFAIQNPNFPAGSGCAGCAGH